MKEEYNLDLYNFELPKELIAQLPSQKRSESRLFYYDRKIDKISHLKFRDILDILDENYCIVLNNTKVESRKIECKKSTGGSIFILITYYEDNLLKFIPYKSINSSRRLILPNNIEIEIKYKNLQTGEFEAFGNFSKEDIENIIKSFGLPPLPPYIKRKKDDERIKIDFERYQTVYAQKNGSIAAPTAGLHFDKEIIRKLIEKNVKVLYITLHVGISTFKPVKTKDITKHKIFPEFAEVSKETAEGIVKSKKENKKIIAVGTTVVRTLEFLFSKFGEIKPYSGEIDLYIYPGYDFKVVSGIITNFHLPKSSNLILISAFVGREKLLELYKIAIENRYRFYSYGDAMLIL
jgi:S-adenosylmethionine:tRNA ribosyltransferase-isomerase